MDLISIIVPIYNVEIYLKRCIDSILKQSYDNFELILVDDGSPDKCGDICDSYAKYDKRVKVIHKKNGGLSDARNVGLQVASGDYIAFVDSDDWVDKEYLSCMLRAIKETDSDICECEKINSDGKSYIKVEKIKSRTVYSTIDALELLIKDQVLHQYVWNKLYKKSCLDGIFFEKGKLNEDEFWTYQVFGRANQLVKIDDVLYFYFQRTGSIMGNGYSIRRLDGLQAKCLRQNYIDEKFPELSAIACINLYESVIYSGQMVLKYLREDEKRNAKLKIDQIRDILIWDQKGLESLKSSRRYWIKFAKINFWGICRIKNFLGKGM